MSYALRRVSVAAFGAVAEAAQAAGKQTGRRGVASSARRNGGAEKPFWSEGTQEGPQPGYLFGESPPPPGQARKWESWELPWYTMMSLSGGIMVFGLWNAPDTDIHTWAREEAQRRFDAEKA